MKTPLPPLLITLLLAVPLAGLATAQRGMRNLLNRAPQMQPAPSLKPWAPLPSGGAGLLPAPVFPTSRLKRLKVPLGPTGKAAARNRKLLRSGEQVRSYDPQAVRRLFLVSDRNRDGYLTLREVFVSLELGRRTFTRMDGNHDQLISYTEFDTAYRDSILWGGHLPRQPHAAEPGKEAGMPRSRKQKLAAEFSMVDRNSDQLLDLAELKALLSDLKIEQPAVQFLNRLDFDADLHLNLEECFAGILASEGSPGAKSLEERMAEESTRSELAARAASRAATLLQSMDLDGNGSLSTLEIQSALYTLEATAAAKNLLAADRDGDGELSRGELEHELASDDAEAILVPMSEFLARHEELDKIPSPLATLDLDSDEKISLPELETYLGVHPNSVPAPNLLAKYDRDRNGSLDLGEFLTLLGCPAGGAAGAAPAAAPAGDGRGARALPAGLGMLDRDEDGALTFAEVKTYLIKQIGDEPSARSFFDKADLDGDGLMSAGEIGIIFTPGKGASAPPTPLLVAPEPADRRAVILAQADSDSDGALTLEEIERFIEAQNLLLPSARAMIRNWDADRDGSLAGVEIDWALRLRDEQPLPASRKLPACLSGLDANGDRRLTPQEVGAFFNARDYPLIRSLFATFDRDLSGCLEAPELSWLGLR